MEEERHTMELTQEMIDTLQEVLDSWGDEKVYETDDGLKIRFYHMQMECRNCGDRLHMNDMHRDEFCDIQCYEINTQEEAREAYEDSAYKAHKDRRRGVE